MGSELSGRLVFSSGKEGDYDLWALDLDTKALVQLTRGTWWNDKPRWSPDGKWAVFVTNRNGTPDVYKVAATGGEPTPLVQNQWWNDFPSWSPNGKNLGYVSNASGNNDLWIADADGQNAQQITTHEGSDSCFAWMPDGKSVLFSTDREGDADIWRLDLATGRMHGLTTDTGTDLCPAPSPCGRYVAFVSNRQYDPETCRTQWNDRDHDVYLMTIEGRYPVRVTSNQGSDRCVAWSPCGRQLIYAAATSKSSASERLRIVDVTEILAAFEADDPEGILDESQRLRSSSVDLDRSALEQEIDAVRHPFFLTSLLPDFLMRPIYGEGYFGSERYPDWFGGDTPLRARREAAFAHSA